MTPPVDRRRTAMKVRVEVVQANDRTGALTDGGSYDMELPDTMWVAAMHAEANLWIATVGTVPCAMVPMVDPTGKPVRCCVWNGVGDGGRAAAVRFYDAN
jgi:hypothetical protein